MRALVALTLRTGRFPDEWLAQDPQVLDTALDLVMEEVKATEEAGRRRH
jgi:hypothetical protein